MKFFLFLILAFYCHSTYAQDTILFIPKTKFYNSLYKIKTDSVLALKRQAILTAKNADELTKRVNELDALLLSYQVQSQNAFKKYKADSAKVANRKNPQNIPLDSTLTNTKINTTPIADAILKNQKEAKARFRADSILTAQKEAQAQFKADSILTAQKEAQAQFKADSILTAQKEAQARFRADSILTVQKEAKAQFRADSILTAQKEAQAQYRADSILTAQKEAQAQFRADSILTAQKEAQARFRADSILTVQREAKAQFRADSILTAQREAKAQFRADSILTAQKEAQARFRADSILTAQKEAKAQFKADSILTAQKEAQARFRADSILTAQKEAKAQFKADSILTAQKEAQAQFRADSIINAERIAKSRIITDSLINVEKEITANKKNNFLDTIPYIRSGDLLTKFVKSEITLNKGEIVSNVLKVVNIGRNPISFTSEILSPGGWVLLTDPEKIYNAKPNDTIVVPVIISPAKLINGNAEIIINAFIVNTNEQQLANNYFSLKTKKKVDWNIELADSKNIYLKNEEEEKRFSFMVNNNGNYKQDLFINFRMPQKNIFLSDTLGKEIKQPNHTFTLEANSKRRFDYLVGFKDGNERNIKRISYSSYSPNKTLIKKVHYLIINSSEPRISDKTQQKRTKVNFIKLPNEIEANKYGYPYIPLTIEMSAQNILSSRSFLSLNLRGMKQISEKANLIYSTNINYSNAYFSNDVFKNMPWYIGYFDDVKTLELGQVSGNLIGIASSGYGIKGSYKINEQHTVGAFYVNSGGFLDTSSNTTFGASYDFKYNNNIHLSAKVGRNINKISNRSLNAISLQTRLQLLEKHRFSFITALTNKSQNIKPINFNANGYLLGTSYSSAFVKKKLKVNFSARYKDRNFSYNNYDRVLLNQRIGYTFNDKWTGFLSTNYQNSTSYSNFTGNELYKQEAFFNTLIFSTKRKSGSYQPGLYYQYNNYPNNVMQSRGLSLRYSNFNYEKNLINSFYVKAGYTKPDNGIGTSKDYFNFEFTSLTRYKTWSVTTRYDLGAFSTLTSQQNVNDFITPQSIRISAQNQYQFKNRHLVLDSNLIYSYNNVFKNHTLGIFPTAYYFTDSGWRFGMSANYTFTTSDYSSVYDPLNTNIQGIQDLGPTTNSNFNLSFNVKKDIGIPIPFVDKTAATATFIAFLDLNGNGIKDLDETTLPNVVIKLNKKEVLTNADGIAVIKNVLKDEYELQAFSLEKLNGWFPNINNKIGIEKDGNQYIPFVRGVKVYGDVVLDRQKIAIADEKPIDLSRIKISANNGDVVYSSLTNTTGRFEFYLPFGEYIITMDEGVLNDRFQISRNNIPLKLKNGQDGVYVSFYIIEKRRKVIFKDFTKKKN